MLTCKYSTAGRVPKLWKQHFYLPMMQSKVEMQQLVALQAQAEVQPGSSLCGLYRYCSESIKNCLTRYRVLTCSLEAAHNYRIEQAHLTIVVCT